MLILIKEKIWLMTFSLPASANDVSVRTSEGKGDQLSSWPGPESLLAGCCPRDLEGSYVLNSDWSRWRSSFASSSSSSVLNLLPLGKTLERCTGTPSTDMILCMIIMHLLSQIKDMIIRVICAYTGPCSKNIIQPCGAYCGARIYLVDKSSSIPLLHEQLLPVVRKFPLLLSDCCAGAN